MSCPNCGGVFEVVNSNGVVDPADGDRWEQWECVNCGNRKTVTLKA